MPFPVADLTAAHLPIYLEPGDALALPITVPSGYSSGTWTAALYRDQTSSTPLVTFTVTGTLTKTVASSALGSLIPRGGTRFVGWWRLKRDLGGGDVRTWVKGWFVVDGALERPANGATAVTVTVVDPTVELVSTVPTGGGGGTGDVTSEELAEAVDAEAVLRAAADTALADDIAQEVTDRAAAVNAEAATRAAADTTLTNNLASEAATRAAADTTLTNNLATETTNRTNADTALSSRLDTQEAMGDPVTVAHGGTGQATVQLARDAFGLLSPGVPGFEGAALRGWRAAWAERKTKPVNILVAVADSNGVGYYANDDDGRWIQHATTILEAANGQRHAVGYQPKNTSTNYVLAWTTSGTITDQATSGIGYGAADISAPSGYIQAAQVCDRFWYRYSLGALIGAFTVHIDGVQQGTNWGTGGSGSLVGGITWDSGPLTRALHTVRITAIDGFGFPARAEGIQWFDGNGNTSGSQGLVTASNSQTGAGIRVFNGARLGATAGTFAVTASTWWTDGLDKIAPHLVIIAIGTNEIGGAVSTTTMKSNIATAVARINTVMTAASLPTPSYLFVVPHGTGANSSTITPYRQAIYEAAAAAGGAVIDRNALTGFIGTAAGDTYGLSSTLDGATRVHLSQKGHRMVGEHVADFLLRAAGHPGAGLVDTRLVATAHLPTLDAQAAANGGLTNAGVASGAGITLAKLANVATSRILGRTTAGSGTIEELTAAQAKAILAIAQSDVTGLTAALAALQPLDADLTAIAALAPADGTVITRSGGAWTAAAPSGGGGAAVTFARATITAGNITLPSSGGWALLSGIPQLSVAADVGDVVQLSFHALRTGNGDGFLDVVVVDASSNIVRYLTTGTTTPPLEGAPGWYPSNTFVVANGPRSFVAASGDVPGGLVRFRLAVNGVGTGTLYADTNYPFYWEAAVFPQ